VILVGLTGGIGAGKSTVSALLAARGAVVIDADAITRQLQEPGQPVLNAIVERFGTRVLDGDGRLNRPALAAIVFNDPAALKELNAIVHPAVGIETARRLAAEQDTDHVVVLDVPLLVETGRGGLAAIIVVDAPTDVAVRRLVEQRGMVEADARARVAVQASREERLAKADIIVDNSAGRDALEARVAEVWDFISSLPHQASPSGGTVTPPR
jgi:dephospho-CoA kinase